MQGLELCRRFFHEVGLPLMEQRLPEVLPLMAAGMGGGSQAHGSDDEHSRDHGWGPSFLVWLTPESFGRFEEPLREVLAELPHEFLGDSWHRRRGPSAHVYEFGEYVRSVVGYESAPDDAMEWLRIPEDFLFEITHRPVFHDGPGEVTRRFGAFARYPEDVWRRRLSACLAWMSEWGVKHLRRAEQRGDTVTANQNWSRFATYAMRVGFLLNRKYAPYHKWLFRHFHELPAPADRIASLLADGFGSDRPRVEFADEIMAIYSDRLAELGYALPDPHPNQIAAYASDISRYAGAVKQTIEDERIKAIGAFVDIVTPPSVSTWTYVAAE